MTIFISLVIFGLGLFLFFITNEKLKKIKDNVLIDDTKKELESLITEFNSAAARNIELLESKITELQEMINRANNKMTHLDDKIGRANRPFVVEKLVDRPAAAPLQKAAPSAVLHRPEPTFAMHMEKTDAVRPVTEKMPDRKSAENKKKSAVSPRQEKKSIAPLKKEPVKNAVNKKELKEELPKIREAARAVTAQPAEPLEPLTRQEQLRKHIQDGLSKQELIALGFMENEINLLNFLIKKKV